MSVARAIGRNTIATGIARFAVLLVWLVATPAVLAVLGPGRFGLWSILFVVTSVLASLDFGVGTAVSRYLGELAGRGNHAGIAPLVAKAVAVQALLVLLLGVPTFLLRDSILGFFNVAPPWQAEARDAFGFTLLAFAAGSFVNLLVACLQGLQRMDLAARVFLPAAVLLFVGIQVAVRDPLPLRALTLVQALYTLVVLLATGFALRTATRTRPPGVRGDGAVEADASAPAGQGVSWREIVGLGWWIQATTVFGLVQNNVDKVLLGRLVSLEPVGAFELASRLVLVAFLPVSFFLGALLPALGRLAGGTGGDRGVEARRAVYRVALAPFFAVVCGIAGLLLALPGALLEAWLVTPPAHSTWMLRFACLAAAFNLGTGIAGTMARATDRARDETLYAAGMVALHVALSLAGFALLGLRGILIGAVVSALIAGVWLVRRVEGWLGVRRLEESGAALLGPLVAAAVAAALVFGIDMLLTRGDPSRARGLVRLGVGGVAYAVLFVGTLVVAFRRSWEEMRYRFGRALAGVRDTAP